MKNRIVLVFLVVLFSCSVKKNQEAQNQLKLWYNQPAERWEEALPIGNGRLGAMVFGSPSVDRVQLNEETVWAGEPGNNLPDGFRDILPQVRKLIFEGKYKEAQDLAMSRIPRHAPEDNNYGMPYQPVGDLWIEFPAVGEVSNYYRELDIQNAVSTVSYEIDEVSYKREYFATAVDQVIAIRVSASEDGKINFTLKADSPQKSSEVRAEDSVLVLSGRGGDADNKTGKVKFDARFLPVIDGGQIASADSALQVTNANSAVIYISIGTNFKSYNDLTGNESDEAAGYLKRVASKSYEAVKQEHIQDYRQYFDRVQLDLGTTDSVKNPTDQRVVDFAAGNDPQLVSLYFQFGRYLLISSSRPGTQPANLQGIWNDKISPPWDSKYTVNINAEMNYWPAEVTNLMEMHEPLFSLIKDISETGRESASEVYGARGWNIHHNTDIWRISGPVDGAYYGLWPMGGAWLSQHLWQHYLYGGDSTFLREVYPILKGAAEFYVDVLQEEPENNWLVVNPSMSPENAHQSGVSIAAGTTMDNQLVFDVFSNAIRAAEIVNRDREFADTLRNLRSKLPPMQVGRWGQLQEWMHDWDEQDDKHRHVSHLYGLYPGDQISPFSHPRLFDAARTSLIARGDKSTGWSMGWKVNLWARLLDGNRAFKLIQDQLSPAGLEGSGESGGTYPNLFDAHPPFQIDGNFGCASGIAEMLVQSHHSAVHLLPALPDAWSSGQATGLRVRGGFEIDMSWENGNVKTLTVHSTLGGNCRIKSLSALTLKSDAEMARAEGDNPNPFYTLPGIKDPIIKHELQLNEENLPEYYEYDFETVKGQSYEIGSN